MQKIDRLRVFIILWIIVIGTMTIFLFWKVDSVIWRAITGIIMSTPFMMIGYFFYSGHFVFSARKYPDGTNKYDNEKISEPLGSLLFIFSILSGVAYMSIEFSRNAGFYIFIFAIMILSIGVIYFASNEKYRCDVAENDIVS